MKKVLKPIMIAALALPTFAFADTTTAAKVQQACGATTAPAGTSQWSVLRYKVPRTGIRYTFANPNQRPVRSANGCYCSCKCSNGEPYCGFKPSAFSCKSRKC